MTRRPIAALALSCLAASAFAAGAESLADPSTPDLRPTSGFGAPIDCSKAGSASVFTAAAADHAFRIEPAVEAWIATEMARVGFGAPLPKQVDAHAAALKVASLLKRGNLVASLMANSEAASTIPAYKASSFPSNFESLLTILTQPVMHASYPSNELAEGEIRGKRDAHSHGVDLERTSASLLEVIRRAQMAKTAMGVDYRNPAVRNYMLANGFHDEVALSAATGAVCKLGLTDATRGKLDVSARFMAMPTQIQRAK